MLGYFTPEDEIRGVEELEEEIEKIFERELDWLYPI